MQFTHYKKYFLFFFLFTLSILRGQDGTAKISLDRDEKFIFNFYAKDNGFWAFTTANTGFAKRPLAKVYKFSPDLSQKEWQIEMPKVEPKPIYDKKNPDYIYFQSTSETVVGRGTMSKLFLQLDKKGMLKTYEFQKEKDKEADDEIVQFTSMNHFCEIWTKKKSKTELVLILHDNETFTKSKKIIQLPTDTKKKKYTEWYFTDVKDSLVALMRYENNYLDNVVVDLILINIKEGTIVKHFSYHPTFKNSLVNIAMSTLSLYKNQATQSASIYNLTSNMMVGAIMFSEYGNQFYYYALTTVSKSKKTASSVGHVWAQLDSNGRQVKQVEYEFTRKDVIKYIENHSSVVLSMKETDAQQMHLEYKVNQQMNATRFGFLYDKEGTALDECMKSNYIQARFLQKVESKVKSIEDLYPCFIKNPERVNEYIVKKGLDGGYSVASDNDHHVLSISVPEQQVVGFIYFHNK
jgi:hypothetical protein